MPLHTQKSPKEPYIHSQRAQYTLNGALGKPKIAVYSLKIALHTPKGALHTPRKDIQVKESWPADALATPLHTSSSKEAYIHSKEPKMQRKEPYILK